MNDEKLHERTEDKLKSEIYERIKKLYSYDCDLFYYTGVDLERIQEEFSDENKDVIRNLLDELAFCDEKLIKVDQGAFIEYIPIEIY
jgi:hypothetical protein